MTPLTTMENSVDNAEDYLSRVFDAHQDDVHGGAFERLLDQLKEQLDKRGRAVVDTNRVYLESRINGKTARNTSRSVTITDELGKYLTREGQSCVMKGFVSLIDAARAVVDQYDTFRIQFRGKTLPEVENICYSLPYKYNATHAALIDKQAIALKAGHDAFYPNLSFGGVNDGKILLRRYRGYQGKKKQPDNPAATPVSARLIAEELISSPNRSDFAVVRHRKRKSGNTPQIPNKLAVAVGERIGVSRQRAAALLIESGFRLPNDLRFIAR